MILHFRNFCFVFVATASLSAVHLSFSTARADGQLQAEVVKAEPNSRSNKLLNQLFSTQWVRLDASHSFSGSLVALLENNKVPMAGLPVYLVQNGEVAYRTTADDQGSFVFSEVPPGSYSLVSRTNESIAAFSLQVLDESNLHLPSEVEVRMVRPAGKQVKEILRANLLPSYPSPSLESQEITSDPLGDSRTFSKSHLIKTNADGLLLGQLGSVEMADDLSSLNVYVLKNGIVIARSQVETDGKFQLKGLKPGVYGFIAVGASGFAATSFQLVDSNSSMIGTDGTRFVSLHENACDQMNVEVVQCCEIVCCEPVVEIVEMPIVEGCGEIVADECGIAPSCGCGGGWGGGGGGFGGGGGGGGGFGGLGAIAGVAGLAVGIAALADSNNDAPSQSGIVP